MAEQMIERIESIGRDGDSCGGVIECVVRRPPAGLGMPVFDKLEADLAKAVMSLPATKGFEIGSGFAGTTLLGSQHNDAFLPTSDGSLHTATNNSGGIQGGSAMGSRSCCGYLQANRHDPRTTNDQRQWQAQPWQRKGGTIPALPRAVPMVEATVA